MGASAFPIKTGRSYGRLTQTAGTAIVRLIQPIAGAIARLMYLVYNAGATAHTLTVMRCLGQTTVASAAAGGQQVINITADPGKYSTTFPNGTSSVADNNISANDYVVYQCADGTFVVDTVSSVSTLAITMTNNLPTGGVAAGAPFWFFGITTDTNPSDGLAHPFFNMPQSTITTLGSSSGEAGGGGFSSSVPHPTFFTPPTGSLAWNGNPAGPGGINQNGQGEPLLICSNNATNQGYIEEAVAAYSDR